MSTMHFMDDILFEIFSYLHPASWFSILLVSKQWNAVAVRMFDPSIDENRALFWACENGKYIAVRHLLRDARVDPSKGRTIDYPPYIEYVIGIAIGSECFQTVQILLQDERVNPSIHYNCAIRWASKHGYVEMVKSLLKDPRVDPSDDQNRAIHWASKYGHVEIVKLLLQDSRVDPSTFQNHVIQWASINGHVDVVRLLLEDSRVNPSDRNNGIIKYAVERGHLKVVRLLLQDNRVELTVDYNDLINIAYSRGHTGLVSFLLRNLPFKCITK